MKGILHSLSTHGLDNYFDYRKPKAAKLEALGVPSTDEGVSVTALAYPTDYILIVGHASGDLNVWEYRSMTWACRKSLKDPLASPVVQVVPITLSPHLT